MELEITIGRLLKIWWAYAWRNIIVTILGMFISGIIGIFIGKICVDLGISADIKSIIILSISIFIGFILSVIPFKMILNKNFGEFKLALLYNDNDIETRFEHCADSAQQTNQL